MKSYRIKREIVELEKKLKELKEEKDKYNSLPREYKYADLLHNALCTANHIDGCGWDYEGKEEDCDTWNEYTHKKYLNFAKALLAVGFYEDLFLRFREIKENFEI